MSFVRRFGTGSIHTGLVEGFVGAVGSTPLLKLKSLSERSGCNILAKAEFMNPGGSVKDRAALFIIRDAEEKGQIGPVSVSETTSRGAFLCRKASVCVPNCSHQHWNASGGTIVEGTAGNTGIGLAHICKARGYKCVIFMPDTQSREKMDLLKNLGAEVRAVPAVAYTDDMNYNHQAKRYAEAHDNCVWTNQFDNVANRYGHFVSTGPEIWNQTGGQIDAFTCATGTGGTFAGVSMYLKQKRNAVKCVLADPPGSVLFNRFSTNGSGKLEREGDGSITEGIGQGRITSNLEGAPVDDAINIPDLESIQMLFRLYAEEGIFLGASSALNLVAAMKVAETMPKGSTIVTVACDGAYRYQSRLFSRKWLQSKGFLDKLDEKYHSTLVE